MMSEGRKREGPGRKGGRNGGKEKPREVRSAGGLKQWYMYTCTVLT